MPGMLLELMFGVLLPGRSLVWSLLYFVCEPGKANFLC